MTITDRTRKLLWGRSGSRCAFCRAELIMGATPHDDESIVGEECHIISSKTKGPRHDPGYPSDELDSYLNLILLCRVHHKMVDDQSKTFTADILHQLKENHERWVSASLDTAVSGVSQAYSDSLEEAFREVESAMPDLISEMKTDVRREGNEFTRDFYLVRKDWIMRTSQDYRSFSYYYEEHENLQSKIQVLENHGFVIDMTTTNTKKYRMMEEFVKLLRGE